MQRQRIQETMGIVGSLLFLGRAIGNTLLTKLSNLATSQAKGVEPTQEVTNQPLNYCAMQPNPTIIIQGSQMDVKIHSDA